MQDFVAFWYVQLSYYTICCLLFSFSSPLFAAGNDYEMLSIVLTFSSGQSVGGVQTTSVTILDDSSVENDDVFTLSINSMDPGVMRGISTAWVTIIEDSSDSMLPCSADTIDIEAHMELDVWPDFYLLPHNMYLTLL